MSLPCGDISQEPDRNSWSLLTVYLMASCSRPAWAPFAASSCFVVASSAVMAAFCAAWFADVCCSCLYWLCRPLYWPCKLLYWPCKLLYWPCSSSYLPCETQPEKRTDATHRHSRTLRFRRKVIIARSPSWAVQKTLRPRKPSSLHETNQCCGVPS